jgi:uncharacterized membrane-anchored protein YhcB (DUF1043 family)
MKAILFSNSITQREKMRKKYFITLFIAFHIGFIALKIDKQSRFIKLSYEKQKLEIEKETLIQQKQELTHHLYALKKPSLVKRFAHEKLQMESLNLKRVKRIQS